MKTLLSSLASFVLLSTLVSGAVAPTIEPLPTLTDTHVASRALALRSANGYWRGIPKKIGSKRTWNPQCDCYLHRGDSP